MSDTSVNNKRIAKNTLLLYVHMLNIMGVTLYTSRVVLDKLGATDYGLYHAVFGVVGMLSFLNGTLANGTSRFLTYEMGAGNSERLQLTFTTTFFTHAILALFIVALMETGGLWFLYHKLIIPPERLDACFWVFQLGLLTTFISITQVPYTAIIIAHERMNVYAYVSIFEALAKLGICYMLAVTAVDRLVLYAILMATIQLAVAMFYRYYSVNRHTEAKLSLTFQKGIFRNLLSFSGWNLTANILQTLLTQGTVVLLNLFFSSIIVAAQAVANQVAHAMMRFVYNFRTAINPQIIKLYAAGEHKASRQLTLSSAVYCFDLFLLLGLPLIYVMHPLMDIWLVEVPDYAVVFTQWIIARYIINTFDASFYTPMLAANRIKTNALASVVFGFGEFFVLYLVLKMGAGPMWVQYLMFALAIIFSFFVKPYILYREIDYPLSEIIACYVTCFKVFLLSLLLTLPVHLLFGEHLAANIAKVLWTCACVAASALAFMDLETRNKLFAFAWKKILH